MKTCLRWTTAAILLVGGIGCEDRATPALMDGGSGGVGGGGAGGL